MPALTPEAFALALRAARAAAHLTQLEAAALLDCLPLRTYCRWESAQGVELPAITQNAALAKLAKAGKSKR